MWVRSHEEHLFLVLSHTIRDTACPLSSTGKNRIRGHSEWLRMAPNGSEWMGMAENGWEWLRMNGNGWECMGMDRNTVLIPNSDGNFFHLSCLTSCTAILLMIGNIFVFA